MTDPQNRRILLVDDSPSIHEDFRKILLGEGDAATRDALAGAKAAFFGDAPASTNPVAEAGFELTSAYQGQEGLEALLTAQSEQRPFAMAFVDVRMPPGWDGIQTIKQLWKADPLLQVVICTAYSDYSWNQTLEELGHSDQLLILKKPFDPIEIRQMAFALTHKWNSARQIESLMNGLRQAESEARAYAASLETSNRALQTAKASADESSHQKSAFLVHLSNQVRESLEPLLERALAGGPGQDLERTLDEATGLMRTLDAVLDLSQLEGQRMSDEVRPTDVRAILERQLAARAEALAARGLTVRPCFRSALPANMGLDDERFERALGRLLDEACARATGEQVELAVSLEPDPDWQSGTLSLELRAEAPLPAGVGSELYEPFGPNAEDMGLAVARRLAQGLGGDLGHESDGRHTTFRMTARVQLVG